MDENRRTLALTNRLGRSLDAPASESRSLCRR
jgi:hypothetical protein